MPIHHNFNLALDVGASFRHSRWGRVTEQTSSCYSIGIRESSAILTVTNWISFNVQRNVFVDSLNIWQNKQYYCSQVFNHRHATRSRKFIQFTAHQRFIRTEGKTTTNTARADTPAEIFVFVTSWHQSNVLSPPLDNTYSSAAAAALACCYCACRYL